MAHGSVGRLAATAISVTLATAGAGCGSSSDAPARGSAAEAAPARTTAAPGVLMVAVPRLVGRRQQEAHRIAARAGMEIRLGGFTGQLGNGHYKVGCVKILRQSPAAGQRRPRGSQITVIETACAVSGAPVHVAH